jgi:hypothetical protein
VTVSEKRGIHSTTALRHRKYLTNRTLLRQAQDDAVEIIAMNAMEQQTQNEHKKPSKDMSKHTRCRETVLISFMLCVY